MVWNFVKPSRSGTDLLMRSIGTICFMASVVLLSYSLWETRISAYFTAQAQSELRAVFESKYTTPPVTGPLAAPSDSPSRQLPVYAETTTTTTIAPIPPLLPPKGELVGRLLIPSIGLDQMILAGTDTGTLKKGPGLWENSVFPGAPGNAMMAGHRTTYGGPFRHLNDLTPGDKIIFEAPGQPPAVFEVRGSDIVSPKQVTVGAQTSGVRLTLTTCDPPGSAAKRLVVQAELVEGAYIKDALPASVWTFQS
jgi:sortase A